MYQIVKTLSELDSTLKSKDNETFILNGGTDFLVKYTNSNLEKIKIIDISQLDELDFIVEKDNTIEIGAITSHNKIAKNEIIKKYLPALYYASDDIGSEQIRNRGTIIGNIVNSSPGGDCIPVSISLEGELEILDSKGKTRRELVENFVLGPNKNTLKTDEVVLKIIFPKKENYNSCFSKYALGNKKHVIIANVSISLNANIKERTILDAKVVLGACSSKSIISEKAKNELIGKKVNAKTLNNFRNQLMEEVSNSVISRPEFLYKVDAIKGLATDVFEKLFDFKED